MHDQSFLLATRRTDQLNVSEHFSGPRLILAVCLVTGFRSLADMTDIRKTKSVVST